jgi:hypothetical protein
MSDLTNKGLTKPCGYEQRHQFMLLMQNANYNGLRLWHQTYTPWCREELIDEYIAEYK